MRGQATIDAVEDTEITLGVGKLLGLFFGLVILCGVTLGVGYSLGRNSVKQAALNAAASTSATSTGQTATAGGKPGAAQAAQPKAADCASGDNCAAQPATSATDLTFYQAVQQTDEHPQLTPEAASALTPAAAPAEAHNSLGTGYLVQIAAVRNQEDAKLLSDTLQKQRYPVLVTQPGDTLFHVQVGPYADVKEAEAMRSRLVAAGYNNCFVKR